jgi:hypothetical protein
VSDTAGSATGTVSDTAGSATGTVSDTAGAATGTVSDTAGSATDAVGSVTGAVGDTAGALTDTAGDTVGTATGAVGGTSGAISGSLLDPTESLGGIVGAVDVGGVLPTSPDTPDPPIGSTDTPTSATPRAESGNVPSPLAHESMRATVVQPSLLTNVHQASTSAPRPDAGGAEPGAASAGGIPFLLDAAAAALSPLTEAGGTGLVWAIFALLVLLPAMDDRWLRFVRAVPPHAAFVAQDGRPG